MSTLLLLCLCIFWVCVCYVQYVTFTAETRRLQKLVNEYECACFRAQDAALDLGKQLEIARGDLAEADAELNRIHRGRLERHTVVCH